MLSKSFPYSSLVRGLTANRTLVSPSASISWAIFRSSLLKVDRAWMIRRTFSLFPKARAKALRRVSWFFLSTQLERLAKVKGVLGRSFKGRFKKPERSSASGIMKMGICTPHFLDGDQEGIRDD